jgi:hypothetical protein
MNADVEQLLRKLALRRPSPALDERITRARPGLPKSWRAALAAGAVAAVAAAAWLMLKPGSEPASKPPPLAKTATVSETPVRPAVELPPLRVEQDFWQLRYDGVVLLDERTPLRRYHRYGLRQVTWIDEGGRALELALPTHEIILITVESH